MKSNTVAFSGERKRAFFFFSRSNRKIKNEFFANGVRGLGGESRNLVFEEVFCYLKLFRGCVCVWGVCFYIRIAFKLCLQKGFTKMQSI